MTQPRRGLGRGLDALFGGATSAPPVPPPEPIPHSAPPAEESPKAPPESVHEPTPPPTPIQNPTPVAPAIERAPAPLTAPEPTHEAAPPVVHLAQEESARSEPPAEVAVQAPVPAPMPAPAPAYEAPERVEQPPAALPAAAYEPPPPKSPAQAMVPEPPATPAAPTVSRGTGALEVDIDLISPNPEQPRTNFEPEKLRELSDSIMEHGIIQPLIVNRDPDGGFRLIAGERRLQAARLAGLNTVPVVIRDAADAELLELALIENIQRADLNAIEEAMAYRRLTDEYGLTQEEAARRVGKSRAAVANALRLLQLEPEIRRSLVAGEITEGHARALLGLADSRGRMTAWREVVKRALNVRDTEGLVRRALNSTPATQATAGAATARRDAGIADIESRLRRALSTRVSVVPQRRGARITIDCFSSEEFEHVVEYLLGDEE